MINPIFLFLILIISCSKKPKSFDRDNIHYLDQKKPENIPQVFAPNIVSIEGRFEIGFTMSPDGKSMAFGVSHETDAKETCIYLSHFSGGLWSDPNRTLLPGNINTFFPMFGPDGSEFYFAKSINNSETDIWVAQYNNSELINPQPLSSIINSPLREAGFGKSVNKTIYFTSNRDDKHLCCGDIFRSKMDNKGNYNSVFKVEELNTEADEEGLFLSPNEDYIIIQSWKNVFKSKHDLYLSYRTKNGTWTIPERLAPTINSNEIEQRPFVSPDKKYLFFSRMSVNYKQGQKVYESDIYWVDTKSIFKPYPYNLESKIAATYNKPFRIKLPRDLFKHVYDTNMSYKASLENDSKLPGWIKFDKNHQILSGTWSIQETLTIKITATDGNGNKGFVKIPIVNK